MHSDTTRKLRTLPTRLRTGLTTGTKKVLDLPAFIFEVNTSQYNSIVVFIDASFYDDYLYFDGKYFVSSGEIKDGILYEWISIIGAQEDANKYKAILTLTSSKFKVCLSDL